MHIHHSHQPYATRGIKIVIILLILFLLTLLWQPPKYAYDIANYLPLHTLLEGVSIMMAAHIFATIASTYKRGLSNNMVLLGILFLGVALLDFSHALSYRGMPDFITPSSPEKAINFWLAARTFSAIAILYISISPWHKRFKTAWFKPILILILFLVISIHIILLFAPNIIPSTFTNTHGLSSFKIAYEAALIAIYILSAALIFRHLQEPRKFNTSGFFTAASIFALGELFLVLYTNVSDIYNLFGHIYKVIATYFLYLATFTEVIKQPYALLERSESKLKATLNAIPDIMFEMDINGRYLSVQTNTPSDLVYNFDEIIGKTPYDLMAKDQADICMQALQEATEKGISKNKIINIKTAQGEKISFELAISCVAKESSEIYFIVISRNITQRVKEIEQLYFISNYDQLTGLPNRNQLIKILKPLTKNHKRIMVLWLDLDDFQSINDALGRQTGDLLLQEIASRLLGSIRPTDILARPIGDEFVIITPDISEEDTAIYAQKILDLIKDPLTIYNNYITITASLGIAVYPNDSNNHQTVLQQADIAMHRSKKQSKGGFSFYKASMQEQTAHKLALRTALAQALDNNELRLEYQPQVCLSSGKVIGAEALLRWESKSWGLISPTQFIPIAEETGTIIEIGRWVLREAAGQMAKWIKAGIELESIAVNISSIQFEQSDFTEKVINILKETGLPSNYLELELTEAVAMKNHKTIAKRMQQLSDANIKISIDDFGTGYSSLSYLNKFNINTLKIDQSFIKDITEQSDKQAIVKAIIEMARSLGIITIAEGVETQQQLEFIRAKNCDLVQGYYYSKPLSQDKFEVFVRKNLYQ